MVIYCILVHYIGIFVNVTRTPQVKTCRFLHTLLMGEEQFLQPSRKGNAWFHSVTPMIKHGYFVHMNISRFLRSQSVPLRRNVTVQVLDQDRSQTPRGQSEPAFPSGDPGTSANVAAITAATIAATAPLIKVDIIRFIKHSNIVAFIKQVLSHWLWLSLFGPSGSEWDGGSDRTGNCWDEEAAGGRVQCPAAENWEQFCWESSPSGGTT